MLSIINKQKEFWNQILIHSVSIPLIIILYRFLFTNMFTGIVQDLVKINRIKKINQTPVIKEIDVDNNNVLYTEITLNLKKFKNLKIGNSIAINGVCLTIAKLDKNQTTFQIVDETMKKSCFSYNLYIIYI